MNTDASPAFYEQVSNTCELILNRKTEQAFSNLDALLRERPNAPELLYLVGLAAVTMEEYGRALSFIEEAHNQDPDCFEYAEVLANLHVRVGNLNEGVYFAKLSTTLEPHPKVHNLIPSDFTNFFTSLENTAIPRHMAFGTVSLNRHEYEIAVREFERHIMLSPNDVQALTSYSEACQKIGKFEKAISAIQKATELAPDDENAHFQAGRLSQAIGVEKPAEYHFGKVAELSEDEPKLVAATLALAGNLTGANADTLQPIEDALARTLKDKPGLPVEAVPSRERKERIHVGYVCNSLWDQDAAALLEPILELHDRSRFEVFMYQQTQGRSAYIQHLNNVADFDRRLWELEDEIASIIVSGDEIDVLVNVNAPEPNNRISLFALAPSVIQVGYLGMGFGLKMPGITHVLCDPLTEDAINARLSDGQEAEVVRPGLWATKQPYLLPDVTPLPAAENGHLTIGVPLDLAALTPSAVSALAKVLHAVKDARIVFGASGATDNYPTQRIAELFGPEGVMDRIAIWQHKAAGDPWLPDPKFWQNIDLFLVPDALAAPLRASDSLWMGVPVLTLAGDRPQTCIAASILASAAKMEWVFNDLDTMIKAITAFTNDIEGLAETRAGLRAHVKRSALFNPVLHVREMEDIFTRLVEAREAAPAAG